MSRFLYINANPKPLENSYSRQVAEFILDELRTRQPATELSIRNLYQDAPVLLDETYLAALSKLSTGETLTTQATEAIATVQKVVDDFLSYDRYVIASPMWNFGITPLLKAYVDTLIIPGKTFRYTASGPVGLLKGSDRKLLIIEATGGFYHEPELAQLNHASRYLEDIFSFVGIEHIKTISIGGTAIPTHQESALAKAKEQALLALTEF